MATSPRPTTVGAAIDLETPLVITSGERKHDLQCPRDRHEAEAPLDDASRNSPISDLTPLAERHYHDQRHREVD